MSNFIEELYYGNIEPQEYSPELETTLKSKLTKLTRLEEQVISELTEKQMKLFTQYVKMYNEFSDDAITDSFITGFRLGAKFTLDTFLKED